MRTKVLLSIAVSLALTTAANAQVKNGSKWATPGGVMVTVTVASSGPGDATMSVSYSQGGSTYSGGPVSATLALGGGLSISDSSKCSTQNAATVLGDTFRAHDDCLEVKVNGSWKDCAEKTEDKDPAEKDGSGMIDGPGGGVGTLPDDGGAAPPPRRSFGPKPKPRKGRKPVLRSGRFTLTHLPGAPGVGTMPA